MKNLGGAAAAAAEIGGRKLAFAASAARELEEELTDRLLCSTYR